MLCFSPNIVPTFYENVRICEIKKNGIYFYFPFSRMDLPEIGVGNPEETREIYPNLDAVF